MDTSSSPPTSINMDGIGMLIGKNNQYAKFEELYMHAKQTYSN